ncbi:adenylate kinase 8-like [Rhea pennata]|uniref:adenylate kinase 8-like n=1 Tax=Rhea pennata TaxID=8795 RepID=UPI002E2606B5
MALPALPPGAPPAALYAERHGLFELLQSLLEALLLRQPPEPLPFLAELLRRDGDRAPRVLLLGPPAAGKTTVAARLCRALGAVHLSPGRLLVWAELAAGRAAEPGCARRGWVLEGLPASRAQALALQARGVLPRHAVLLRAPDAALLERALGRRLDPATGHVYHTTFAWPADAAVQRRLVPLPGDAEARVARRLLQHHRQLPGILRAFGPRLCAVDADQPCADVCRQVLERVRRGPRAAAPFAPRLLLCGPPGSGKRLQAALLRRRYGLADLRCGRLLRAAAAAGGRLGRLLQPCLRRGGPAPDGLVLRVLRERMARPPAAAAGWVLHGFPRDLDQAELLAAAGLGPNRVVFLTLPAAAAAERVTPRRVDPVSGKRFHALLRPAPSRAVQRRLRRHPRDSPEALQERRERYDYHVADLELFYRDAIHVNANQDPETVFECIESYLVHPLPCHSP